MFLVRTEVRTTGTPFARNAASLFLARRKAGDKPTIWNFSGRELSLAELERAAGAPGDSALRNWHPCR